MKLSHLKEYEDLMGDLRSLGYDELVGYAMRFLKDGEDSWILAAIPERDEKKVAQFLGKESKTKYDGDDLEELLIHMYKNREIDSYKIFKKLKVKQSISPQLVHFPAGNPFRDTKEIEKFFEGNLYEDFNQYGSNEEETESIPLSEILK
jgi:hypothetical protein